MRKFHRRLGEIQIHLDKGGWKSASGMKTDSHIKLNGKNDAYFASD